VPRRYTKPPAAAHAAATGDIAIVLVEQYLDFAQALGDYIAVMDRGQIVYSSTRAEMDGAALKRALAI
jgi:urea transport system ATP-binding protein